MRYTAKCRYGFAAVLWLASGGVMGALAAPSSESGVQKVVRTPLPYWQVGDIDKDLSVRCSMGEFNQRVPYKFSGHFSGATGSALVGGAKGTGLNLFDSRKRADPKFDYWFYRDRTSACIVFKAPVKNINAVEPTPPAGVTPGRP
jgi:hypothetical protein